ncbi:MULTISPECIES: Fe-S-containing hydro-lyase [Aneurinibacillus]|jgi:fumarate hydratase subunit beta|uniref:Fumarate hydratase n=1 Tax=Aneurinibacillus danicus TaxID=267746 RepID=A0A511V9F1_9BACL|nr:MULTISPECIES: Fe-S-containing hydro-lyase [Aneurinibacillus]GEN35546.1 fumarate hydratase [Aneurinibacillus danicus]
MKQIQLPLTEEQCTGLRAGDRVELTGTLYTARDAAHKRMAETLESGGELPVDVAGQVIYYVGPTPARPGQAIGSAGPTTSSRMDAYTPRLLEKGLRGMIGKGKRSETVKEAIVKHRAVYFAAVGGAAALIAKAIRSAEVVAYEDLGTEAIHRLVVERFPVIVVNDAEGNDLYEQGETQFRLG